MREWRNPYNSFNSYKGLLYRDQFNGIIRKKLMPPVEVNIDPVNNCQLNCIYCNSKAIIDRTKSQMMSTDHLLELIEFCSNWGVKAICFAGGGEATMHPNLGEALVKVSCSGMEAALITNGLFISNTQIITCAKLTRWVGVSVDASNKETFKKLKGVDAFDKVIENSKTLMKYRPREANFKFLIHPLNQGEIYDACKLAKSIGFSGFHARPIADKYGREPLNQELIERQVEKCHQLADHKFTIYTISHKQKGPGHRRIRFHRCQASPLLCMLEANGDVSVCIDRKGDPKTRLCGHNNVEELRKAWGSPEHFNLLERIRPERDCPKCTMTIYQELLEAYKHDRFCINFPIWIIGLIGLFAFMSPIKTIL